MEKKVITLEEFIVKKERDFPRASGDLSGIIRYLALASKIVNREVNKAGLVDILGTTGTTNIQGEEVKKLDDFANLHFKKAMEASGVCAGIASEEEDDIVVFDSNDAHNSKYVVMFDPLDGSSNIDVNVSIGTIFSVFRRVTSHGPCTIDDFLQKGDKQMAAGYIVYGSSTMLVYTTGYGVNGFTLDPSIGEYCLSHPQITAPQKGKVYSVNQGNFQSFSPCVQEYINHCILDDKDNGKKPYSLRYIGSLVADFHRNLLKGGIYLYPATNDAPNGKLRLLYECNPLAFISEQAGDKASTGVERILDVAPTELHQRVPLYIGTAHMVAHAESYLKGEKVC